MRHRWTEQRVLTVLYSYRDIVEVLRTAGAGVARYDDAARGGWTEPAILTLACEKADIERAIAQLPWPRLVPAVLYWIGGYSQGEIAALLGRAQQRVDNWLEFAEADIVGFLVRGRRPRTPGPRAPVHPFWWAPLVVELFLSGQPVRQDIARGIVDEILRRKRVRRGQNAPLSLREADATARRRRAAAR